MRRTRVGDDFFVGLERISKGHDLIGRYVGVRATENP